MAFENFNCESSTKALDDYIGNLPSSPAVSDGFSKMSLLVDTANTVYRRGTVSKSDVLPFLSLENQYTPMRALLSRYPIGSYTEMPSLVNSKVCMEGFIDTAKTMIIDAFKWIIDFFKRMYKNIYTYVMQWRSESLKLHALKPRIDALKEYITYCENNLPNSNAGTTFNGIKSRTYKVASNNLRITDLEQTLVIYHTSSKEIFLDLVDVLSIEPLPFLSALEAFIAEIETSKTAVDLAKAVAVVQGQLPQSPKLAKVATKLGIGQAGLAASPNTPDFKVKTGFIASVYRSMKNSRLTMTPEILDKLYSDMEVDVWNTLLPTENPTLTAKLDSVTERLKDLNNLTLDPSIQNDFNTNVLPFVKKLALVIDGFDNIQTTLATLSSTHDSAIRLIADSMLGVAKSYDKFVADNKSGISVAVLSNLESLKRKLSA